MIRVVVWIGVMMCSQMPDTTKPMANPARPDAKPPRNAARRKSPRTMPSMAHSLLRVSSAWMAISISGEAAIPRYPPLRHPRCSARAGARRDVVDPHPLDAFVSGEIHFDIYGRRDPDE